MAITTRQFFTKKPKIIEYMTLDLYHQSFGYLRFYTTIPTSAAYFDKTFNSITYQPAAMEVTPSVDDDSGTVSYQINFGRVGSQTKDMLKAIDNTKYGWMIPVYATIKYYLSTDMNNPYRNPIELTVGSVDLDQDAVSITIDSANPRLVGVARKYNTEDFPGTGAKV